MGKAFFFHLRKLIKATLPHDFGSMKALQPSDNFNHDGRITYCFGDFDALVKRLQAAVGDSYRVSGSPSQREITIQRITG